MILNNSRVFTSLAFLLLLSIQVTAEPFTATDMHSMNRVSGQVLSSDKKYIAFANRKWNKETGKSATNIMYTDLETKQTLPVTEAVEGQSDSNPFFSSYFPNHILFLRGGSIYYKEFPPTA